MNVFTRSCFRFASYVACCRISSAPLVIAAIRLGGMGGGVAALIAVGRTVISCVNVEIVCAFAATQNAIAAAAVRRGRAGAVNMLMKVLSFLPWLNFAARRIFRLSMRPGVRPGTGRTRRIEQYQELTGNSSYKPSG